MFFTSATCVHNWWRLGEFACIDSVIFFICRCCWLETRVRVSSKCNMPRLILFPFIPTWSGFLLLSSSDALTVAISECMVLIVAFNSVTSLDGEHGHDSYIKKIIAWKMRIYCLFQIKLTPWRSLPSGLCDTSRWSSIFPLSWSTWWKDKIIIWFFK